MLYGIIYSCEFYFDLEIIKLFQTFGCLTLTSGRAHNQQYMPCILRDVNRIYKIISADIDFTEQAAADKSSQANRRKLHSKHSGVLRLASVPQYQTMRASYAMAQWSRVLAAVAEDMDSVASSYTRQLTNILIPVPGHLICCTYMYTVHINTELHTHMHMHVCK